MSRAICLIKRSIAFSLCYLGGRRIRSAKKSSPTAILCVTIPGGAPSYKVYLTCCWPWLGQALPVSKNACCQHVIHYIPRGYIHGNSKKKAHREFPNPALKSKLNAQGRQLRYPGASRSSSSGSPVVSVPKCFFFKAKSKILTHNHCKSIDTQYVHRDGAALTFRATLISLGL